jgi:hypothetical protein
MRRLGFALTALALGACQLYRADESCPGENPGSCSGWSECVTTPGDPGFGQCGGEIYVCEDGAWVVDGWCEPAGPQECEEPRPGCPGWAACDAGQCLDIPLYECDERTGEWVDSGTICEGVFTDVTGDLYLEQSVYTAAEACPPLRPRNPLVLFAQDDGTVTASPPTVILEGEAVGGWGYGSVAVMLVDDWAGTTPTVEYDLDVSPWGEVAGLADVTLTDCNAQLIVRGALCPRDAELCVFDDDGWGVWCSGGVVYGDDLTRYVMCAQGTTDEVCEYGGEGNAAPVATCPGACGDTGMHWFETNDEYQAFDPASLCAP